MSNLSASLIDRPEYVAKLYAWKSKTDLVKIVTGVRRCGKSKLFSLFQAKIMTEDNIKSILVTLLKKAKFINIIILCL